MHPPLTDVEVRILGALVEKEATTPDTYPLSLNALVAACNQTTNREPVMSLDDAAVTEGVVALRRRSLLRAIQPIGSRVTKYQHLLTDALQLDARELAVLGVLMLRGPQTTSELHTRTARLADFSDSAMLESTLEGLMSRDPEALVSRLPRRAGQKEQRFAHLLAGEPQYAESPDVAEGGPRAGRSVIDERVATLERTVEELRAELTALREQFDAFRGQFQ